MVQRKLDFWAQSWKSQRISQRCVYLAIFFLNWDIETSRWTSLNLLGSTCLTKYSSVYTELLSTAGCREPALKGIFIFFVPCLHLVFQSLGSLILSIWGFFSWDLIVLHSHSILSCCNRMPRCGAMSPTTTGWRWIRWWKDSTSEPSLSTEPLATSPRETTGSKRPATSSTSASSNNSTTNIKSLLSHQNKLS